MISNLEERSLKLFLNKLICEIINLSDYSEQMAILELFKNFDLSNEHFQFNLAKIYSQNHEALRKTIRHIGEYSTIREEILHQKDLRKSQKYQTIIINILNREIDFIKRSIPNDKNSLNNLNETLSLLKKIYQNPENVVKNN